MRATKGPRDVLIVGEYGRSAISVSIDLLLTVYDKSVWAVFIRTRLEKVSKAICLTQDTFKDPPLVGALLCESSRQKASMKRQPWSSGHLGKHDCEPGALSQLEVEIRSSVTHTVTLKKIHSWLTVGARTPIDAVLKERLRELLELNPR